MTAHLDELPKTFDEEDAREAQAALITLGSKIKEKPEGGNDGV